MTDRIKCDLCDETFAQKRYMLEHRRKKHGTRKNKSPNKGVRDDEAELRLKLLVMVRLFFSLPYYFS